MKRHVEISLAQMKTIRITCQKCGKTVETADMKEVSGSSCSFCGNSYNTGAINRYPLTALTTSIEEMIGMSDKVRISFLVEE